jgi:alcohol dehydrogenase (NADP+)
MRTTTGWQAAGSGAGLLRAPLERRDLRGDDVAVRVDYCGVCHTDLHAVSSGEAHPLVPGHELTGVGGGGGPRPRARPRAPPPPGARLAIY